MDDGADDHGRWGRAAPGVRARIRYRFDNLLARGTAATLIWLGAVTAAAVLVSSLLLTVAGVTLAGSEDGRWLEDVWQSLLRVMDSGTMAADVGWGRRILALFITVFGLLVAGTLIGIIAAGVEDRIDSMRRGRSVVIESDHVVVLGASGRLPALLHQLVLAGAEGGSRTIVVLADLDPAEMRAAARQAAAEARSGIRIVYRSGDPTVLDDLALVRLPTARAVIVLSDGRSDVAAAETVLAVSAALGGLDDVTVVVELVDEDTARRLRRAYGTSLHPIVTSAAVVRTTAIALRQPGLGQVVSELLDFRGSDLHIVERPELVGTTFGRLVGGLVDARPIGLLRADGRIDVAPPFDAEVGPGDRIAVIARDARHLELSDDGGITGPAVATTRFHPDPVDEHIVVIGWNALGRGVLTGWAETAAPSSRVELLVDPEHGDPSAVDVPDLGPIPVDVARCDDVTDAVASRRPTTVIVLAPPGDHATADVRTILDARALRRELAATGAPAPRLVVELHDADHRALLEPGGPDDLVVSDAMGSPFIAQLVDQPERRDVLLALYSADEASLRLVRCDRLGVAGECVVGDLVQRAAARGLLLIGWRRSSERGGTVTLDPHLTDRVRLDDDDELVVVG